MSSFSCSSSSSGLPRDRILTDFAKELNIPIHTPAEAGKIAGVIREALLGGIAIAGPQTGPLADRIRVLRDMLYNPIPAGQIDAVALGVLQGKMKGMVERKVAEIEAFIVKEQPT